MLPGFRGNLTCKMNDFTVSLSLGGLEGMPTSILPGRHSPQTTGGQILAPTGGASLTHSGSRIAFCGGNSTPPLIQMNAEV